MSALYRWVKLRSWHLTYEETGGLITLCGRLAVEQPWFTEPEPNERTCERCYQIRESDA